MVHYCDPTGPRAQLPRSPPLQVCLLFGPCLNPSPPPPHTPLTPLKTKSTTPCTPPCPPHHNPRSGCSLARSRACASPSSSSSSPSTASCCASTGTVAARRYCTMISYSPVYRRTVLCVLHAFCCCCSTTRGRGRCVRGRLRARCFAQCAARCAAQRACSRRRLNPRMHTTLRAHVCAARDARQPPARVTGTASGVTCTSCCPGAAAA